MKDFGKAKPYPASRRSQWAAESYGGLLVVVFIAGAIVLAVIAAAAVAAVLAAVGFVYWLVRHVILARPPQQETPTGGDALPSYAYTEQDREQLRELHASGDLSEAEYVALKARMSPRMLDRVE